MVKSFSTFAEEPKGSTDKAGIVIVLEAPTGPMVLLIHPTNGSWQKPIMEFQKAKWRLANPQRMRHLENCLKRLVSHLVDLRLNPEFTQLRYGKIKLSNIIFTI
jgi:hypothetical protein